MHDLIASRLSNMYIPIQSTGKRGRTNELREIRRRKEKQEKEKSKKKISTIGKIEGRERETRN